MFLNLQFSCSVMSKSLWPHELQYSRPPCPSPTPGVHTNSRPSSQWCHPAISSSVVSFSSCPQSLPASESFPMSQLCFIFSIIPSKEILGLIFRMDWLDLLAVQGTLKHIHKQRHHFANKGLSSHGHGFSCGHIWMWELDCEEGWAPKNWCFWTVVFCTLVPTVLQPIRLMS